MTDTDLDATMQNVAEKMKQMADCGTVKQFRNRLEVNVIIAAYLEKRFKERFPEEYAMWVKEQE